jgi:hypothetical protein
VTTRLVLIALWILTPVLETSALALQPSSIAGRWHGHYFSPGKCADEGCDLAFDIVSCGTSWCGVLLAANDVCGGHALTLDAGEVFGEALIRYQGRVELAKGTAPYRVRADLDPSKDGSEMLLNFVGASESVFPFMDRDFPFSAMLARTGDAVCTSDGKVSSLH